MITQIIENTRDPRRITVEFHDKSCVDFVLGNNNQVIRSGTTLPMGRDDGTKIPYVSLTAAEKAAYAHFFGENSNEYETLMDGRAADFSKYIHTGSTEAETPEYTTTALRAFARVYLKSRRWCSDMDELDLVHAVRSYWGKKSKKKPTDEVSLQAAKTARVREFRREEKARQISMFD